MENILSQNVLKDVKMPMLCWLVKYFKTTSRFGLIGTSKYKSKKSTLKYFDYYITSHILNNNLTLCHVQIAVEQ